MRHSRRCYFQGFPNTSRQICRNLLTINRQQLLFLIYGGSTIVVGTICLLALPDTHDNACFLTKPEREEAKARTRENQTGGSMRKVS